MVANTRKMYELKQKIKEILEIEEYTCEMFNAFVAAGAMNKELLDKFVAETEMTERLGEIKKVSSEEIYANPYLQDIKAKNIKYQNISIRKTRIIPANTVSSYNAKWRDPKTFLQHNSYFICDDTLRFPGLVEGDGRICWMTVEPIEINTFEKFLEEAKGNVLLIGCGLGYIAYMLSLKENVENITIIDLNDDVLTVFNQFILPQFKNKDKITTFKSDAMEYLEKEDLSKFDYINVDIWHDTSDMAYTYLPCLAIAKKYPNVKFSYWLEEELKEILQKCILANIADYEIEGYYLIKRIAADIVNSSVINNRNDITKLLELEDLRDILYNWYMNNYEVFSSLKVQDATFARQMLTMTEKMLKKANNLNADISFLK